jgi:hypothetical protein
MSQMKASLRLGVFAALLASLVLSAVAQQSKDQKKVGVLDSAEIKTLVPTNYFFDGQVAPVQLRNAVAIRLRDGHVVLAGLVDNSGYSSDVQQKYQGFFINESKLTIEGSALPPGQYGFGFTADGKFRLMDVGGNDVFIVSAQHDDNLKRPVPLKATDDNGNYHLYAGKKYVTIKVK